MAKDPVCGMNVDETRTILKSEHKGKTYYFCSSACQTNSQENPEQYAKSALMKSEVAGTQASCLHFTRLRKPLGVGLHIAQERVSDLNLP